MSTAIAVLYVGAHLVAAIMLGCMLQSKFVESGVRFRLVVAGLGAAAVGCMFYGLRFLADGELAEVSWSQLAHAIFLAAVLVMMRARQVSSGEHEHPRVRRRVPGGGYVYSLGGEEYSAERVRAMLAQISRDGSGRGLL